MGIRTKCHSLITCCLSIMTQSNGLYSSSIRLRTNRNCFQTT